MGDGVVVTGIGVVSPIGTTVAEFWRSLLHAESRPEVQAQVPVRYMRYRHGYCIRDFPRATSAEGDRAGLATSYAVRATEAARHLEL